MTLSSCSSPRGDEIDPGRAIATLRELKVSLGGVLGLGHSAAPLLLCAVRCSFFRSAAAVARSGQRE